MANYEQTGDSNIINKIFTGTTQVNISDFIQRYQDIKQEYLEGIARTKADATVLYNDLKPIYDSGWLPTGFTTQYNQLETFVTG